MRVRISRPRAGAIDGIELSDLEVGIVYNLPSVLAEYLIVTQSADIVEDSEPDRPEHKLFRGVPPPPAVAADDGGDVDEFVEALDRLCGPSLVLMWDDISVRLGPNASEPLSDESGESSKTRRVLRPPKS